MKTNAVVIAALLCVSSLTAAQSARNPVLLQKAHQAFISAQALDSQLNEKPEAQRTRAEYLKVINAYQKVYVITPHTSYADDALIAIARLYEKIQDTTNAIHTLTFLIREYPATPFK